MASSTLHISLPESLKPFVEAQVESGAYGNPSDYVRDLILNDRERHLGRLEDRLLEAMNSEPIEISDEEWESEDLIEILRSKLPATQ
jgi:antitoxin ParD1/3/4